MLLVTADTKATINDHLAEGRAAVYDSACVVGAVLMGSFLR